MANASPRQALTDSTELLLRRVHPTQVKDGRPSKTTFVPRPSDQGMLSVDRASVSTASQCYDAYVASKGFQTGTGGIWGVTVGECNAVPLTCFADPLGDQDANGPNLAHALIDMSRLSAQEVSDAATKLYIAAKARGRLAPT